MKLSSQVRVAKIPISSGPYLSIPDTESIPGFDLSFEKVFRSDPVSVATSAGLSKIEIGSILLTRVEDSPCRD